MGREVIIKDTHRGLRYEDGVLTKVLGAGRYVIHDQIAFNFLRRPKMEIQATAQRLAAQSQAEVQQIKTEADIQALKERSQAAQAYSRYPALLRLQELETLRELSRKCKRSYLYHLRQYPHQ